MPEPNTDGLHEIEFEILELEDPENGAVESFGIVEEFEIEGRPFVVLVPEQDLESLFQTTADVEIRYTVMQHNPGQNTYFPPEERYVLLAQEKARAAVEQ